MPIVTLHCSEEQWPPEGWRTSDVQSGTAGPSCLANVSVPRIHIDITLDFLQERAAAVYPATTGMQQ